MSTGIVATWSDEEGWGTIESDDTPGGCWAFYSALWAQNYPDLEDGESVHTHGGFRTVEIGETVEFDWEVGEQDGYSYRAVDVRPRRNPPHMVVEYFRNGEPAKWPTERFGPKPG